jgi:signal transduction histidine kinase
MGEETYGLLQFNDKRKKHFTSRKISLFERLAGNLAVGLAHKLAEDELRSYQSRLKAMASQLSQIQERERRQLAVELHDRIAQSLTMVKFGLETAVDSFEDTEVTKKVKEIAGHVGKTIEDAYSLMIELSNPVLYEIGLEAALDTLLQTDLVKNCGIKCKLVVPGKSMKMNAHVRVALYQAARELLVNAIKHSNAKEIEIHLHRTRDGAAVTVQDDGIGFEPSTTAMPGRQGGFGLFNIRESIEGVGGDFTIVSKPGESTSAKIWVPLSSKDLPASKGGTNENAHC